MLAQCQDLPVNPGCNVKGQALVSQITISYYKPPYPLKENWKQDLLNIRELGVSAIQVEMPWGWIEPEAENYQFDDYDQIFEDARSAGLEVIAVLKPEYQPSWATRTFSTYRIGRHNSEYFKEIKSPYGTFPGCNPDHPDVWDRMSRFIQTTVRRYQPMSNLKAWVAMNLDAPYPQIFDSTVRNGYESYIQDEYKSIEELNKKWNRRYRQFSDIGSALSFGSSSSEELVFLHYQTVRLMRHLKARIFMIRSADNTHPVVVYGNRPFLNSLQSVNDQGEKTVTRPMASGNDWELAEASEIFGCTCYPKWANQSDSQRDVRLRFQQSAAIDKPLWVGEHQSTEVTPATGSRVIEADIQQRWMWQSISMGADNVTFYNWRDDVIGSGAGYFGMAGQDGGADDRLKSLRHSIQVIEKNKDLFDTLVPEKPSVGVLFSPKSLQLCQSRQDADHYWRGFYEYCEALSKNGISYRVIQNLSPEDQNNIDLLFAPRLFIIPDQLEFDLNQFVDKGGTLVTEAQCGGWTESGVLIEGEDRWLSRKAAISEGHALSTRVRLESMSLSKENSFLLQHASSVWPVEAEDGETLHETEAGEEKVAVFIKKEIGAGKVYAFGSFLGGDMEEHARHGLPDYVHAIIKASEITRPEVVFPQRKANGQITIHGCESDGKHVYFIFCSGSHQEVGVRFPEDTFDGNATELLSGAPVEIHTRKKGTKGQDCRIPIWKDGVAILKAD